MPGRKGTLLLLLSLLLLILIACDQTGNNASEPDEDLLSSNLLTVNSPAFAAGEPIPQQYSCDGEDVPPPLVWEEVPEATESYALILDDPDAPRGTWVHWVVYNIPADVTSLPEAAPDDIGIQGNNSWDETGYGGPCPPGGEHRYFFKVYALDTTLRLDSGADKEGLLGAMEGHVLAQGQLMGTYKR